LGLVLLIANSTTQWFLLGSVAVGVVVATVLARSHRSDDMGTGNESARPEITMHRLSVGGGVAGLIFAVGSCLIFVVGIPMLRWFLLGAVVIGFGVAGVLWWWHRKKPVEITDLYESGSLCGVTSAREDRRRSSSCP
jgi:hypothetical protein